MDSLEQIILLRKQLLNAESNARSFLQKEILQKPDDCAKLRFSFFLFSFRNVLYESLNDIRNWNQTTKISIRVTDPIVLKKVYYEKDAIISTLNNEIYKMLNLEENSVKYSGSAKGIKLTTVDLLTYGSRLQFEYFCDFFAVKKSLNFQKSVLILQRWIRRTLYAPKTGILYQKAFKSFTNQTKQIL
jgi:hypothetical protein